MTTSVDILRDGVRLRAKGSCTISEFHFGRASPGVLFVHKLERGLARTNRENHAVLAAKKPKTSSLLGEKDERGGEMVASAGRRRGVARSP